MNQIGHNIPDLQTELRSEYESMVDRTDELVDGLLNVPDVIDDPDTEARATDFVKQLRAQWKLGDSTRKNVKEPYLESGRQVDGFFKNHIMLPVEKAATDLIKRIDAYKEKVEAAERAARVAAAEQARREAEAAQRKADEERRIAEAEAAESKRRAEEAERKLAEEQAARKKAEDERLAAIENEEQMNREIAASAEREKERQAAEAEAKRQAEAQRIEDENNRREAEAKEKAAQEAAQEAQARLIDANKAAEAKPADLTRTRGDLGGVSSRVATWTGEITDLRSLDLELLRDHIAVGELEKAVIRFAKVTKGAVDISGARIFEKKTTRVV